MSNKLLYLIGTPIGNLSDISQRALQVLSEVDLIAAEDTRRTAILLNKYKIKKPLESYHNFNKEKKTAVLVDKILSGMKVALVSDSGMPCISDPGAQLVDLCAANNITVLVIPGPCAGITALSGSGIDSNKFVFEGFIPSRGKQRKERLLFLQNEPRTIIFYEALHRIIKTLKDFKENGWSQRKITFGRELTKVHEEFIRTNVEEAIVYFETNQPRGEFVLVLEGLEEFAGRNKNLHGGHINEKPDEDQMHIIIDMLSQKGESTKDIAAQIAKQFLITKKEAYLLTQKRKDAKRQKI